MALDLIVRGGQVVTPWGVGFWEIGVQGERIAAVAEPGTLPDVGARVLDASGKLVIPGGIEPHAHAAFKFVYPWAQGAGHRAADPAVLSKATAFGGTTTVVDFANWRLYREGARTPCLMSIGLPMRLAGHPARAEAFHRFLDYAQSHAGVLFTRRIGIANWWCEHFAEAYL